MMSVCIVSGVGECGEGVGGGWRRGGGRVEKVITVCVLCTKAPPTFL